MDVINAYESFQSNPSLPFSVNVDVMLLLLGLKPCLRTKMHSSEGLQLIKSWCHQFKAFFHVDHECFIYISFNKNLMKKVIEVDQCIQKHEETLGKLLGYPECCSKKIASIGEDNIDEFEQTFSQKKFQASYHLINPKNYPKGKAFISHVPCSTSCINSLKIAQKFYLFLKNHETNKLFEGWIKEVRNI